MFLFLQYLIRPNIDIYTPYSPSSLNDKITSTCMSIFAKKSVSVCVCGGGGGPDASVIAIFILSLNSFTTSTPSKQ